MKLTHILRQLLEEQKKKEDRCKRIADRRYDKPSAYKSGSIVRCRQGKIWKKLKENLTSIPVERVLRPNGAIGTQGVTTDQIKGILQNVLNLPVPENATMREMVDLFKKDKKNIDNLLDFTKKNPIVILELPDGTIQIKDGHHRAFLLHQAGIKELPVVKK